MWKKNIEGTEETIEGGREKEENGEIYSIDVAMTMLSLHNRFWKNLYSKAVRVEGETKFVSLQFVVHLLRGGYVLF